MRAGQDGAATARCGTSPCVRIFPGWHLMKPLSVSERYGWARYVAHQVYYSLVGRDYEWDACRWRWTRSGRADLVAAGMGTV